MLKNLLARILIFEQIQEQVIEFKRGQLYHFNLPTVITIFNHNEHFRQHEKNISPKHDNLATLTDALENQTFGCDIPRTPHYTSTKLHYSAHLSTCIYSPLKKKIT